jgi:hypothetical protein
MFNRIACPLFLSLIFTVSLFAQDPTKVAPDAYKLQFENDLVKVFRLHYGPRAKVLVHDHSKYPAAYVYLNDAGTINFKHTGWEHPILTRGPVATRSFRLSPTTTVGETHEVENMSDIPSESLRIEFKTRPDTRNTLHGRFAPEKYADDRPFSKQYFENDQVRATRVAFPAGSSIELSAATDPVLFVLLSSEIQSSNLKTGDTIFFNPGEKRSLKNNSNEPVEFLRFDLRSRP